MATTIKRLPPDSVLRSAIILFDLTRVVEELVFNSIDVKATKVSVFVGVATCCIKVVHDVVVRDLFYNQPVRRKYMQASPKKVLHTVKECVHRIALVYPMVSFKVVDIESDDEILCSHSSASPMSRLMSSFGIEDSISLHELNASDDGVIKLSGYISAPCGCFSSNAFQYVCFVCKSPVHKLMNMLAAKFEALDPNSTSQKGKRSRFQAYPTFLINISCPRSLYDLTFEPSKTCANFKDWEPILTFIKKTINHIWTEDISLESFSNSAGKLVKYGIFKDEYSVSFTKEDVFDKDFPRRKKKCKIRDDQKICMGEYNNQPTEMEFVPRTDYSIQLWDSFSKNMCQDEILSIHNVPMKRSGISPFRPGRCGLLAVENDLLSNSAAQIENTGSDTLFQTHSWDLKMFPEEDPLEGISRFSKDNFRHLSTTTENYTSFEDYYNDASGSCKFLERNNLEDKFLEENSDTSFDNAKWYFPESFGDRYERQKDQSRRHHVIKERSKRSHSAPPFHKQGMKVISLSCNRMVNARNPSTPTFHSPGAAEFKKLQSSRVCDEYLEDRFATNLGFDARPYAGKKPAAIMNTKELLNEKEIEKFNFSLSPSNALVEGEELQNEEELEQFQFSCPPSNMPVKDDPEQLDFWLTKFSFNR